MKTQTVATRQPQKRLVVKSNIHAGFDWNELWLDMQEMGSDINSGLSETADSATTAVHNATAPSS